jgi:CheY-like chemotaxis protein
MKKILVIDDEAPVARLIGAALNSAGVEHTLDYCSDGGQGRTKAAQGQYDLITLDLHMPLMGGIEALREMKQSPKSAAIPVIVITAQQDSAFHKRAKELGAAAVVTKPFRPDDLGSILAQVLAGAEVELPAPRGEQDDELRPLDV